MCGDAITTQATFTLPAYQISFTPLWRNPMMNERRPSRVPLYLMHFSIAVLFLLQNGAIIGPAIVSPLLALCCYGMGFGSYIESFMKALMSISYLRYGLTGFSLALYTNRPFMDCPSPFCLYANPGILLRDLGMEHDMYYMQIIALLAFTTLHRVVAYFALRYRLTAEFSNKFMVRISKFLKHR